MSFTQPLISMQFDTTGCLDKTNVINLGGITFNQPSSLGLKQLKCAYFKPYDNCAGFYIKTEIGSLIKEQIQNLDKDFTIYFKYKIKKEDMPNSTSITPLISFRKTKDTYIENENIYSGYNTEILLGIKNKRFFDFKIFNDIDKTSFHYYSKDITHTLDGNWHLFTLTRSNRIFRFFVDGLLVSQYQWRDNYNPMIEIEDEIFIGWSRENNEVYTFNNGCIDDFIILDKCIYKDSFVPPTNHFWNRDILSNYRDKSYANIDNIDSDLEYQISTHKLHSISHLNEIHFGLLPRRLRLTWYVDTKYFETSKEKVIVKKDIEEIIDGQTVITTKEFQENRWVTSQKMQTPYTDEYAIHVTGNDTTLFTWNTNFYESNYLYGMKSKELMPIVVFVNGYYVKLSKIRLVKSHDWFTFFIKHTAINGNKIDSFAIILLPFNISYVENLGFDLTEQVLYSFNDKGEFTNSGARHFYYFEEKFNSGYVVKSVSNDITVDDKLKDVDFFHNSWRYGTFESKRIDEYSTSGAYVYFMAWDNGWIKPGDEVLLYKNSEFINPDKYEIIGYDLLYFYDYPNDLGTDDGLISMQIITDGRIGRDWLFLDHTITKVVQIPTHIDKQSTFNIPQIFDDDGIQFNQFFLFKNSRFIYTPNKYEINWDNNTVRILNRDDYFNLGDILIFVFTKTNLQNANGYKYMKPVYFYPDSSAKGTIIDPKTNQTVATIKIPEYEGLEFNRNIFFLFIDDNLISPNRYRVENNTIIFMNSADNAFIANSSTIVLCLLRFVDVIEEPLSQRDKMISEEIKKGRRFVLFDLNIPKEYSITIDNFTCFDNNGKYVPDLYGYVYGLNIIKHLYTKNPFERVIKYLTCVYHTKYGMNSYNNVITPNNDQYLKNYLKLYKEFYELDSVFYELMNDFDIEYSKDDHYSENLARALDYMVIYNQSMFTNLYMRKRSIIRRTYNANELNRRLKKISNNDFLLTLYKDYQEDDYRTYSLFFIDGKLAEWNKDINYYPAYSSVHLDSKIDRNHKIESFEIHGINNFLIPIGEEETVINSGGNSKVEFNYASPTLNEDIELRYYLRAQITVGNKFIAEPDFTASITIYDKKDYDMYSKITVIDPIPTPIPKIFDEDILTVKITACYFYSYDEFIAHITPKPVILGTDIGDLSKYTEIYDFVAHITLSGEFYYDFNITLNVDDY